MVGDHDRYSCDYAAIFTFHGMSHRSCESRDKGPSIHKVISTLVLLLLPIVKPSSQRQSYAIGMELSK